MKKVASILVVLLLLFSLSACDNTYYFDYDELKEKVQKIELIDYNADTEEEQFLTVISESEQEQFLKDLSQIKYNFFFGPPSLTTGHCIKLTYKNNDYEIITWHGTSQDGRIKCNRELFEKMLSKYYPN